MTKRLPLKKYLIASAIGLGITGALVMGVMTSVTPAQAQFTVFDPSNYSQNILTAARTLQQINNQVQMLQNQAQSLLNQAKNLTTISFPELTMLQQDLQKIDQLMAQASTIQFHVVGLNQQYQSLYPTTFNSALTNNQHVTDARTRLATSMSAYQQTMTVQAQIVENIAADETTLNSLVTRSQGSEGALQAQQTTNQLLALVAKQQLQLQNLMAAQFGAIRASTAMGFAASTAYTLGQEAAGSSSVGAGIGGMARAAGGGAKSRMSESFGVGQAAESGRQAAWKAMTGTSDAANADAGSDPRAMPGWARAMKTEAAARHHRQAAIHTLQQGSGGGHGATPDIKERDD
jgi:P-type conjugative transfer protein TrbJ